MRIVLGMVRRRDLHPSELLGRGAELVHVAPGGHGVHVRRRGTVGKLELHVGLLHVAHARRGACLHAFRAGPAGERYQRDVAAPCCDRLQRVTDVNDIGGATRIGCVDVAETEAHVVDHRQSAEARRIARSAKVAVDIALAQPGIVERPLCNLCMQLRQRLVWRLAGRVLIGPSDVGLPLELILGKPPPLRVTCREGSSRVAA